MCTQHRPHHGTAWYVKQGMSRTITRMQNISKENVECILAQVTLNNMELNIVRIYRKPNTRVSSFYETLELLINNHLNPNGMNILLGDFNINWAQPKETKQLRSILCANNYKQHVEVPTTENETIIDHIYTNFNSNVQTIVLENYYSDHKAIALMIQ